ncbi:hypothetical protein ACC759_37660, partial [Rhizobium ruizarguesonis]
AVAWSKSGVGHGVKDVIIRDPVVVTSSLPNFLAPGDKANLRLDIANTDAPAGDYNLQLTGNDARRAVELGNVEGDIGLAFGVELHR